MVRHGIVLGHEISKNRIKVDKANIEIIAKLLVPKYIKDIWYFLGHAYFYRRFIKDFRKIARLLTNFLAKDMSFTFDGAYLNTWEMIKFLHQSFMHQIDQNHLKSCASLQTLL